MAALDADSWADIDAPITVVFAIVADLELVPKWQPDVKVARCLQRDEDGRAVLVRTEMETVIRRAEAHLRISYSEPSTVSWVMVDGDVQAQEGSWTLQDLGDGRTRVHYAVKIDFGRKLGLLLRGPAAAALRDATVSSMPDKLKTYVEQHADGSARRRRGAA